VETLLVALVVSVIAPLVLAYVTSRARRAEKQQDWERQDLVEKRVAQVAKESAAMATAIQQRFDHVDEVNDETHKLVNSRLTLALEGQLDGLLGQAVLMRAEPNIVLPGARAALRSVEARIDSLQETLMDRAEVDSEIAASDDDDLASS
jgi:hypothetical protein